MNPIFISIVLPFREEEKENIKTEENRESFCASAKSYDKKLKYLQSEKERILAAYNEAIEKLRKGSYLEKMVKKQDNSLKRGLIQMFGVDIGGTKNYLMWQQYLNGNLDVTKIFDYILYVGGWFLVPLGSIACAVFYVENYINYFKYDNEIEAYQRRIRRK